VEQRRLGASGLRVSRLALGTMTWGRDTDADEAGASLLAFLDAGGTLVDTADVYADGEAEAILGGLFADVIPRTEVVLATKAGARREDGPFGGGASRSSLLASLDASLERMGTDYVDLWQLHAWDPEVPLDETLSAIDLAVSSGRVRYAGVANYAGWQVAAAARSAGLPLVSVQSEYSLLERGVEDEVLPAASYHGMGLLPWGPLCSPASTATAPRTTPAVRRRTSGPTSGATAPSGPRGSCRPWSPPRTGWGPPRWPSRWRGCGTGPGSSPRWSAPATAPSCWAPSPPRS
jgi:aryl-alcohol dehydrogenase-like predicted oxidoreductase